MSGDFETLEINQPKFKYLKPNSIKWRFHPEKRSPTIQARCSSNRCLKG